MRLVLGTADCHINLEPQARDNPRFIRETREGREIACKFDTSALANRTNAYRTLT